MSFLGYQDFRSSFQYWVFLTSNLQDVEAQQSTTGWSKEEDDLEAEQQNAEFRYQKRDLDTNQEP